MNDDTFWPVFLLFGVPLIVMFGGPYGVPALVILGTLAGLVAYPMIAIPLLMLWCLRWLIVDFFLAFIAGLGGGLGLKASGVFRRDRRR